MNLDKRLLRVRFDAAAKARTVSDFQSAIGAMEETFVALGQFIAQRRAAYAGQ